MKGRKGDNKEKMMRVRKRQRKGITRKRREGGGERLDRRKKRRR